MTGKSKTCGHVVAALFSMKYHVCTGPTNTIIMQINHLSGCLQENFKTYILM